MRFGGDPSKPGLTADLPLGESGPLCAAGRKARGHRGRWRFHIGSPNPSGAVCLYGQPPLASALAAPSSYDRGSADPLGFTTTPPRNPHIRCRTGHGHPCAGGGKPDLKRPAAPAVASENFLSPARVKSAITRNNEAKIAVILGC